MLHMYVLRFTLRYKFEPRQIPHLLYLLSRFHYKFLRKFAVSFKAVSDLETFVDLIALPGGSCENLSFPVLSLT